MIRFVVPLPPSTNNLYANRPGGRVITGAYQRWLTMAGWEVQAEAAKHRRHGRPDYFPLNGRIAVEYQCERPNRRRDLGNCEKPLSDLLVKQGIIRDDRDIEQIVLQWSLQPKDKAHPMVYIGVWEI